MATVAKLDAESVRKLPKGELADRWGPLKAKSKAIDAEIDLLKEEFERRGLIVAEGEKWGIVKSTRTYLALRIKAIRAEMGEAWCKAREEPQARVTYEVNPRRAA